MELNVRQNVSLRECGFGWTCVECSALFGVGGGSDAVGNWLMAERWGKFVTCPHRFWVEDCSREHPAWAREGFWAAVLFAAAAVAVGCVADDFFSVTSQPPPVEHFSLCPAWSPRGGI